MENMTEFGYETVTFQWLKFHFNSSEMSLAFKGQVYNDLFSIHNNILCILSAQVDLSLYA